MKNIFKKLKYFFQDNFTDAGRSYVRNELANKVLEAHGLKALRWDDGVPMNIDNLSRGKMDLYLAVKTLRRSGHLIVDKDFKLIGSAHRNYYESSEERAQKRRESFQLVRQNEQS